MSREVDASDSRRRLEPSDEELVRRARAGDRSAFGELSDRYRRPLFNAAYRIVGSREEAQDVAQQALVKAYMRLDRFDLDRRFFSWMYRIGVNEALDCAGRSDRLNEEDLDAAAHHASPEGVLRELEREQVRENLHRAIQELPSGDRALIVLHYLAEMSYAEVAQTLEIPIEKVRSRLFSARRRLRLVLEAQA